jgi:hypothetical protein
MTGSAFPRRGLAGRAVRFFAAAALLLWAAGHLGCEGGSTGVDNPGLTVLPVEFRDEAGGPLAVKGWLEIYERDHNPAVDSAPLRRLAVEDGSGLKLTAADFDRMLAARPPKAGAGTKRTAAAGPAASDSLVRFNLVFRSASGSGAVAAGLAFDPVRKRFVPEGAGPAAVKMLPKPLLRFAGILHREAVHGALGRVILPGTPFQATLADSDFVLEGLPEGRFPMQLLDGGGSLFAVRESLDTQAGHVFTAAPEPIGRIAAVDPPAGFGVDVGLPQSIYAGRDTALQGRLLGADSNDSRVAVLWRFLDKAPGDTARLADPTRLRAVLRFPAPPGYTLELSATFGAVTVRDTLQLKVVTPPGTAPAMFIYPKASDTIAQGTYYKVAWSYPTAGKVRLEVSYKGLEASWQTVADSLASVSAQTTYEWQPPMLGSTFTDCYLRLKEIPSDSVLAISPPFVLRAK